MTKEHTKNNTFNLVYKREYVDSDSHQYDDYFPIYYTIFRNIPLSQLNRLNNKDFKNKVKEMSGMTAGNTINATNHI